MRVRATQLGFYGNQLREPGSEFEISDKKELGSWMVKLADEEKANKPDAKSDGKDAGKDKDKDAPLV